jgi:hypothetical protein
MNAQRISAQALDRILNDFEVDWSAQKKVDYLYAYASKQVAPESESFPELLEELILIDIEKRWKFYSEEINLKFTTSVDSIDVSDIVFPVTRKDYELLIPESRASDNFIKNLCQAELNARWAFGDIPDISTFDTFSVDMRRPKSPHPIIRVLRGKDSILEVDLYGRIEIGRQSERDPVPPAFIPGNPSKIVCSGLDDTSTSRQQLSVWNLAKNVVALRNNSSNRNLSINGKVNLSPSHSRGFRLNRPVIIHLKDVRISIESC